ncbi:YqhR family membrane protein [Paenibacillus sp. ACRRX]|uniref:YqhR family membrane protein n=1 Tax=Paenibacillus sp. ACRRX TaxID=2918206 RepID=UPI001EF405D5|nr:YqhR family membrane protein [Paenibacillus sp. ACRRX]MCG7406287.1 YqhR family membrane protein [Paenibacillus sp. ACRRX]
MNEQQYRQQHHDKGSSGRKTNPFWFAMQLGMFAGLIWGGLRWMAYAFHFTIVVPGFLIEPFYNHSYLVTARGGAAGYVVFIGFSMLASVIYTMFMKKIPGPWAGIVYGIVWWVILFVAVGPMIKMMPPVTKTTWNSIYTDFCLFLLWGLFIGYTVAMEFNDERLREPGGSKGSHNQHSSGPKGASKSGSQARGEESNDNEGRTGGTDSNNQPEPVM